MSGSISGRIAWRSAIFDDELGLDRRELLERGPSHRLHTFAQRVRCGLRFRRAAFELLADLHQPEHLVLTVGATALEVLDLVLDRLELLGVHDAAVVEPFVLGGGLLRERVDLVLELGLIATDHVELQPELAQARARRRRLRSARWRAPRPTPAPSCERSGDRSSCRSPATRAIWSCPSVRKRSRWWNGQSIRSRVDRWCEEDRPRGRLRRWSVRERERPGPDVPRPRRGHRPRALRLTGGT